ncbi:MAG: S8 family serine peptidase [Vicingaceae bacterium]
MNKVLGILLMMLGLANQCLAQQYITGFELNSEILALDEKEKIDVVLFSKSPSLQEVLGSRSIPFRRHFKNYYRVSIQRGQLESILATGLIQYIESPSGHGFTLNDTMRSLNNIDQVHNGQGVLNRSYKGNGVIIGFIDTGIDFKHPDFQDSLGKTRVIKIWDQSQDTTVSNRIPSFGYGQVWDSFDINLGNCPHDDDVLSHGSNVAGIAAGNGLALNRFQGAAPESEIIFVASDFSSTNWLQSVADGVEFIFLEADKIGRPCVINISAGDYLGSHDGYDLAALRIDSMIKAEKGRAVVAAAGNSGNLPYHLGYTVSADTSFTWFDYNASSSLGYGAVYFQLWADTSDFNDVHFAIGSNLSSNSYSKRAETPFDQVKNRLNSIVTDTLKNASNNIGIVQTFASLQGSRYFLEVLIKQPDSSQYLFSFITTGSGRFDVWSDSWLGHSHIRHSSLPSTSVLPEIIHYKRPDTLQTIVSSFTCLPSVITVGNYTAKNAYLDYDSIWQTFPVIPGKKAQNSSLGPNRLLQQKPDLIASGDYTLTANRLASIPLHIANNQADRIAFGGFHKRNGGTSMASPVVAGTVALLFEQCPMADYKDILDNLTQTAALDSFTTPFVPNYSYGFGKNDAFAAMANLPSAPTITHVGGNLLRSSEAMNYQWYHNDSLLIGENQQTLVISANGAYRVEVHDKKDCSVSSVEIEITTLGINSRKNDGFISLVPNPSFDGKLRLYSPADIWGELLLIKFFDSKGDLVLSRSVSGSDHLDFSHAAPGLYHYAIVSENGRISSGKIVIR